MDEQANNTRHRKYEKGDNEAIEELYNQYFKEFCRWCWKNHFGLTDSEINMIYTDAVLSFREKVWFGGIEKYRNCSDKTILFAFAKNLMKKHFSDNKEEQEKLEKYFAELEDEQDANRAEIDLAEEAFDPDNEQRGTSLDLTQHPRVKQVFDKLSEACRDILIFCCAYELPTGEVVRKLGYSGEDSLKSQKHKCMKKVKSLISEDQAGIT